MRILLYLIFLTASPAIAQDIDFNKQLTDLTNTVRLAETQNEAVEAELKKLKIIEAELYNKILDYRYEATRINHALESLKQSPSKNAFLLPNTQFLDHFYELRHRETLKEIIISTLQKQTNTLLELQNKQEKINQYIQRRNTLSLTLLGNLEKLKMLNDLRLEEPDLKNIINKLKIESDSLDVFLNSLITIPSLKLATKKPLIFTMPVSGIVEKNSTGIEITAASQSLVTTPARGNVVFADEYKKLGKIIIINHGEGYISILRNFNEIFVKEGLQLRDGEPIGTLPYKNMDKLGNNTMLYYELRYNNNIINPIEKITGS